MQSDSNLLWIDLEMTGLDPMTDTILEIASIITDNNLNIVAYGPSLVIHHSDDALNAMNDWCKIQHAKSRLSEQARSSTITLKQAEQQTMDFVDIYCKFRTSPLCGNSVYHDKAFLVRYMPHLIDMLHYRIIDTSTIKEVVRRWYSPNPLTHFKKQETHRALADIEESIAELKQYKDHFFMPTTSSAS